MKSAILIAALCIATILSPFSTRSQSANDIKVLEGLSPVAALANTDAGQAALGANFTVTGGIQTGDVRQPILLPFPDQQQQALRDVFITDANLAQLADGLGTTLGSAYLARFHYIDRTSSTPTPQDIQRELADSRGPHLLKDLTDLIGYANATTSTSSNSGKYFFANATKDGTQPAIDKALAIFKDSTDNKRPDMFGRAYNLPGGSPGADKFGNSRPFQTEPTLTRIFGRDYFGTPADNIVYNRGPIMDLTNSPSFPSGHTTYGYMGSVVLAVLVPDRYPEMMVRAAEYGNDRIIIGAHYAMDVIAGRTVALYDLAHLLKDDDDFMNQKFPNPYFKNVVPIKVFSEAVKRTRAELADTLKSACGNSVATCAKQDTGRMSDPAIDEAFYTSTLTYGLPVVHPETANILEDVKERAPEALYLLKAAYPSLSDKDAYKILTETEGPGGGFLDDGKSPLSVYSRLNLYAASRRAAQLTAKN